MKNKHNNLHTERYIDWYGFGVAKGIGIACVLLYGIIDNKKSKHLSKVEIKKLLSDIKDGAFEMEIKVEKSAERMRQRQSGRTSRTPKKEIGND